MPHMHQFLYPNPNLAPYPYSDSCECGVMRDYAANHHPYRIIKIGGRPCKIDEGMIDTLEHLWDAGVHTAHCCQGGCPIDDLDGRQKQGYISFATDDIEMAMTYIEARFQVVDMHHGVTLHAAGDALATAAYFMPKRRCEMCELAAASWAA